MDRPSRLRDLWIPGALAILALHWLAPLALAPDWWGVATWRGIPGEWRVLLFVVTASLLTERGAARFAHLLERPRLSRGGLAAAIVLAGVLFGLLATEVHWGNAEIVVKAAVRPTVVVKHPLSSAFLGLVEEVLARVTGEAQPLLSVGLVSVMSGCAFVWGAVVLAHELFPDSLPRARVAIGLLCTAGWMQEFFAALESYPMSTAGQVWTLALLVRLLRPARDGSEPPPPVPLLFAASLTTSIFIATVFLWPAVLLAILLRRAWRPRLRSLLAVAAPPVVAVLCHRQWGRQAELDKIDVAFGGLDSNPWVPLTRNPEDIATHFTFFSYDHLAGRSNLISLVAPAFFLLLLLLLARRETPPQDADRRRLTRVLAFGALSAASMLVMVHPDMGPVLDWMQTNTGVVLPYVFLVFLVLDRTEDRRVGRVGVGCIALSVAHTLPWVLSNAGVTG